MNKKVTLINGEQAKKWLVAGLTVTVVNGVYGLNHFTTVLADETEQTTANMANQTPTASTLVSSSNLLEHFSLNGSASFDPSQGLVTLTPDSMSQSGNLTLNDKIDLNSDFTMAFDVSLGDKNMQYGGGDGVSVGFHTDNTNAVGTDGAALGLGGLSNAFGFKFDSFYDNQIGAGQANAGADPTKFSDGKPFGSFVYSQNGTIQSYDGPDAPAQEIPELDGSFVPVTISYNGTSHTMTVTYGGQTWTRAVNDWETGSAVALTISASTGQFSNLQQLRNFRFDYVPAASVDLSYVDQNNQTISKGTVSYPNGAYVNQDYTTEQADIPGYRYVGMSNGSLPASGTLTKAGMNGVVSYQYTDQSLAEIHYVDDDTNKEIGIDTVEGEKGAAVTPVQTKLADLLSKGYEVTTSSVPTVITLSSDPQKVLAYTVHLRAKVATKPETKTVSRTVNYYKAGESTPFDSVTQSVTFVRDIATNAVTGLTTPGAWRVVAGDPNFAKVESPLVAGYSPDVPQVSAKTAKPDDGVTTVSVRYQATEQKAQVVFLDGVTGRNIGTQLMTGKSGTTQTVNIQAALNQLLAQGYLLGPEGYPAQITFDTDSSKQQIIKVTLNHHVVRVTPDNPGLPGEIVDGVVTWPVGTGVQDLTREVTETIYYQYLMGGEALPTILDRLHFSRSALVDLVTRQVIYDPWQGDNGTQFGEKITPILPGYIANIARINKIDGVDADTTSVAYTVVYQPLGGVIYITLPGDDNPTQDETVRLPNGQLVTLSALRQYAGMQLSFIILPDGTKQVLLPDTAAVNRRQQPLMLGATLTMTLLAFAAYRENKHDGQSR